MSRAVLHERKNNDTPNLIDEGRIMNPGKVAAPFADS
jgi:hypothetical protein